MAWNDEKSVMADVEVATAPIAREELTRSLKQFEDRRQRRSAELEQSQMQTAFLQRECQTLAQACEALMEIIRRNEEVVSVPSPMKPNW